MWFGIVLLSVLVDEQTDEGYHARDLDKEAGFSDGEYPDGERRESFAG